jgi:hypothetical protein
MGLTAPAKCGLILAVTIGATCGPSLSADESWRGTWKRIEPAPGNGQLTITQKQGTKGTIRLTGTLCLSTDTPAEIAIGGQKLQVDVRDPKVNASFVGTIAGQAVTGTMTVTCGGLTGKGTWEAKKS